MDDAHDPGSAATDGDATTAMPDRSDDEADAAGRVERLWTATEGGAPMTAHDRVQCAPGGIRGDRYFTGRGYYSGFDECEVTFVRAEAIDEIRTQFDIDLTDGRHRRNVVLRGADLATLRRSRFRVGEAVFEGTRWRPPCAHVEAVAEEEGVARALKQRRGGICADVLEGGPVARGDTVTIVEDPQGVFEGIVDRLRGGR